ncbi:hypothetical protein LEMLEM_LOCUS2673 [Lemmus lemmus]
MGLMKSGQDAALPPGGSSNQCFRDSPKLSFSHPPKFGKVKGEKQDPEVGGPPKHVMGEALALTRDPPTCYSTLQRAQLLLKVQVRERGLCFRGAGGGVRRVGVVGHEMEIRGSVEGRSCVADSGTWG